MCEECSAFVLCSKHSGNPTPAHDHPGAEATARDGGPQTVCSCYCKINTRSNHRPFGTTVCHHIRYSPIAGLGGMDTPATPGLAKWRMHNFDDDDDDDDAIAMAIGTDVDGDDDGHDDETRF